VPADDLSAGQGAAGELGIDPRARVCPACDYRAELAAEQFCPRDGAYLVTYADLKAAENDPMLGRRIADFAIVARVGSGGMGTVYRAIQIGMERTVALKVLRAGLADDPQVVQRFLQEARATARLQHRNLAITYTSGSTQDGLFYIAMEYIAGGSLASLIEESWIRDARGSRYALEPARALRLFCQIVAALSHAHRLGIVHRDLKPDNVLLCDDEDEGEQAKVVDFGIAKILQGPDGKSGLVKTDANTNLGTALYMAPERFGGAPGDPRMDVYSLGLLLHELVTGLLPFASRYEDRETPTVLLHKRLTSDVPALSMGREISVQLSTLHADLLQRDPQRRPAHAGEVRTRLREVPELASLLGPEVSGRLAVPSNPPRAPQRSEGLATHPREQTPPGAPRAGSGVVVASPRSGNPALPPTRSSTPSSGSFPGPSPTPTPPQAVAAPGTSPTPVSASAKEKSDSSTANVALLHGRPLRLSLTSWLLLGCAVLLVLLVLLVLW
jgi:serine/threonine protein kinase